MALLFEVPKVALCANRCCRCRRSPPANFEYTLLRGAGSRISWPPSVVGKTGFTHRCTFPLFGTCPRDARLQIIAHNQLVDICAIGTAISATNSHGMSSLRQAFLKHSAVSKTRDVFINVFVCAGSCSCCHSGDALECASRKDRSDSAAPLRRRLH